MAFRKLAERLKVAGPHDLSLQFMQVLPGTPFAIRGGEKKEERLPGMRRWVDRDMLERALEGRDQGMSLEDYLASEDRASLKQKLLGGAAIGGLSGYVTSGGGTDPLKSTLAGILLGSGAGAAWHGLSSEDRARDAQEAFAGAEPEIAKFPRPRSALPQERQDESSAAAVAPTLLHTGPSLIGGR